MTPKVKLTTFTKLIAWQRSHELVIGVLESCEKMQKIDVLKSQLERSAISITSNIAEGFGRQTNKDKKHFYVMARGSAYELQNQLLIARDMKKITELEFQELARQSLDSVRLIHGLIRSILKSEYPSS